MKIPCRTCGIHFPKDFDDTNKPACNFWGDSGFTNVSKEIREKFWVWLFSMPADEIFILTDLGIVFNFGAVGVSKDDLFENNFPEYSKMTEEEQQEFQKDYFKNNRKKNEINNLSIPKNVVTVSKVKN